jgi:hypothetical protein
MFISYIYSTDNMDVRECFIIKYMGSNKTFYRIKLYIDTQ